MICAAQNENKGQCDTHDGQQHMLDTGIQRIVPGKELAQKLDAKRKADAAKVLEKDRNIAANL